MEAIVYSKPIVYGKPIVYCKSIVFKSKVGFPCVSNNFRGTQLTWQYHHHHRHRCRLGFTCYHHHHWSIADEQLKLVTIKETPATQIVKPKAKAKAKPKQKSRVVEKLLRVGDKLVIAGLMFVAEFFLIALISMPNEIVVVRPPSESSSIHWEEICSKLKDEEENMISFMLLSTFCSIVLIVIPSLYEAFDDTEYRKRLALKIVWVIFMLGFLVCSLEFMSILYTRDTLICTIHPHWNWPLNLFMAILLVLLQTLIPVLDVQEHYKKIEENEVEENEVEENEVEENDSEKGLDFKVSGAISMGVDVASSPEFLSIAYTIDTLSRTVFRNWQWPYNVNPVVFFISLHICCRGVRAVLDLHDKHSRLPGIQKKSFNKRSSKKTTRLRKKSSRRQTNRQKKDLEKTTQVVELFLQEPIHRSSNLCNGLQEI